MILMFDSGGYSEKKLIGYHSKGVKGQMEF